MSITSTKATIDTEAELILAAMRLREKRDRYNGGTWVWGSVGKVATFEALVFIENSEFSLGDSRISKLCIRERGRQVACYDRGWDQRPTTPLAKNLVDLLAAGLAETVFGR